MPSGASTGENETIELPDGDQKRFLGKGTRRAVSHINGELAKAVTGLDALRQVELDRKMIELDGTPTKSRLGANAILGVSMVASRAAAQSTHLPLYRYLGGVTANVMPVPQMNILNGGVHADNSVDPQEFLIVPFGAPSFSEAIQKAGYTAGKDVGIALDPAASEFYDSAKGRYIFTKSDKSERTPEQMAEFWANWVRQYPIISLEDGMAENDWEGWKILTRMLGGKIQLIADDIFVTNTKIIAQGRNWGPPQSLPERLR